jgi:hypothetical protein
MIIKRLYERAADTRIVVFSAIITLLLTIILMVLNSKAIPPGSPGIIALQFAFTESTFVSIINQWGIAGVTHFLNTIWIDYIFPVVYAIFFSSFIAWLTIKLDKSPTKFHIIVFALPFIAGFLDWCENTLHIILLSNVNNISGIIIFTASVFALIKWLIVIFSVLIILYYIFKCLKMNKC